MPIYLNTLPYNLTMSRNVALPKSAPLAKGEEAGFGNLVFLMSPTTLKSLEMINSTTVNNDNKYYWYEYTMFYKGRVNSRTYNIRHMEERKKIYKLIEDGTELRGFPPHPLSKGDHRNTYLELCTYLDIFFGMTPKLGYTKKMNEFWAYLKTIMLNPETNSYGNKIVLIDLANYSRFKGDLLSLFNNPVFILYYTMYKDITLLKDFNIDFVIYSNGFVLKINPSLADKNTYKIFLRELNKILRNIKNADSLDIELSPEADMAIQKESLKKELTTKYNFTGTDTSEVDSLDDLNAYDDNLKHEFDNKDQAEISKKINTAIDTHADIAETLLDNPNDAVLYTKTAVQNELDTDKEMIETMYNFNIAQKVNKSPISSKRDEMLRQAQQDIKVGNMTMKDVLDVRASTVDLESRDVSKALTTTNDNMKTVRFASFEKVYNEKVMKKDILGAFTALNKKDNPMYIRKIAVDETSDKLNYKETYKVELEDGDRGRHTITVDLPKMLEDKFLYLNGNKLMIMKQDFLLPVVKTEPNKVQIVTNYNKMFIERIGTRSLGLVERLKTFTAKTDDVQKYFKFGNVSMANTKYLSVIEYDELSKVFMKFTNNKDTEIYFNQQDVENVIKKKNITVPKDYMLIGFKNDKPIFVNVNTQLTDEDKNISEIIINSLPEDLQESFKAIKGGKRLMYNVCTIHAQAIPLVSLLCFWESLTEVLKKANINYRMANKLPKDLKIKESYIKFSDGYLIYEDSVATSLLLNGLNMMDTTSISLNDMDTQTPYIEYFNKVYGNRYITNTLYNAKEFFIDEITLEVLEDINLPTDIVSLAIYASNLLCDNAFVSENHQSLYRTRSNEVIPAILHYVIANNYVQYKVSGGKKKFSIPRDAVLKELMKLQTVEDYSTLNPIVEIEKSRTITAKGWRGANVDRAYTLPKRSYDPTMVGIFAMNTPSDGNCGVTRTLSLEPNVKNARGYLNVTLDKKDINKLKDVNLLSGGELLTTLGARHDDTVRTAMATKQSKHVIPVKNSSPVLISNGAEQVARFNLSSDYVINAKMDGEVVERDVKAGLLVLKYKDGTTQAVDLNPRMVKNGGGGFYLANQLTSKYQVGNKFKKDDCIAYHKDFFSESAIHGVRLNMGSLEKVAIMSSYNTYQDSNFVTKKFTRDTSSDMTFKETAVIGKNATLDTICKIGDHVDIGETLVKFDTSYDESELNKFLSSMSDELREEAEEISRNNIKAGHSGTIKDIKVYAAVELEELSPSIRKVVAGHYNRIDSRQKMLDKYDKNESIVKCGLLFNETTGKTEPNKYGLIKGYDVKDGILIEFYIEHTDIYGVGDKCA